MHSQRQIRLSTIGALDLRDADGRAIHTILAQPRRLAILSYLAIARPYGFHRRDALIALFWPERPERAARDLLNTNLSRLRAALGADAILSRGGEEVAINPDVVWCDVRAFDDAVGAGRLAEAAALYRGELLPAFHIDDAPEFAHWMDGERHRLRTVGEAVRAAHESSLALTVAVPTPAILRAIPAPQPATPAPRRTTVRLRFAWLTAAMVLSAAALALAPRRVRGAGSAVELESVAVFPFDVKGSDAEYLREGMTDLLTAKLDGAGSLRGVDPRAVVMRMPTLSDSLDVWQASAAAHDLGARFFVIGSSVHVGKELRIQAALYDTHNTTAPVAAATADGAPTDVLGLVDRLARGLLAGRLGDSTQRLARIGAETTHSIDALKLYLAGERLYRRGDYAAASESFQGAIRLDSTFAVAYYRLSNAAAWLRSDSVTRVTADRAVALAATVPQNEASLFQAWSAYVHGDGERAERIYRAVVTNRPTDAEAWYRLAEVLFHYGPTYGRPLSEARDAFTRLARLEPDNLEALLHLGRLAAVNHDAVGLDSVLTRYRELGGPTNDILELTELLAILRHDVAAERGVRAALELQEDHLTSWLARAAMAFAEDPQAAARLGLERFAQTAEPEPILSRMLLAHAELAQGHWSAASAHVDRLASVAPPLARELRVVLGTMPFVRLPDAELRVMLEGMSKPLPPGPGYGAPGQVTLEPPNTGRYAEGLLRVALHDSAGAIAIARSLDDAGARPRTYEDTLRTDLHRQLARGIRARLALDRGDANGALAILGTPALPSLRVLPGLPQQPTAAERFLRAQALAKLGRSDEALGWLASFPDPSGYDIAYVAPAHLLRAQLYEARHDTTAAVAQYRAAIRLWKNADEPFQPMLRAAQDRLERLGR